MPTQTPNARRLHIWRQIAIRLPADWELLQFSCEFERGRCAFADRHQFRCEMSWQTVRGEPDYERMVSDYMSKLEHEKKLEQGERAKKSGWHGFAGIISNERTSRFGRYLAGTGCLIEIVFLWPQGRDADLESEILASIEPSLVDHQGYRRWQAFGMNMLIPAPAAFEGCTALPARAEFSFTDTKTGNAWNFSRLGMLSSWFDGQLEPWLRRALGKNVSGLRITHRDHHGADMIIAEGRFKPQAIHLRKGDVTAIAWIDKSDGRLYCAKQWLRRATGPNALPLDQLLVPANIAASN